MSSTAVIGMQFGDEGKSKIIDYLLRKNNYQIVTRYQGGRNAGHTQWFGNKKVILHIVPSGITHEGVYNVVLTGCFFDPLGALEDVKELESLGYSVTPENLGISGRAHVTLGYHIEEEKKREQSRGKRKIDTTLKGIGPTARDKVGRTGIRFAEFCGDDFHDILSEILKSKSEQLGMNFDSQEDFDKYVDDYFKNYAEAREFFSGFLIDEAELVASRSQDNWLFEGAQAIGLDVDYGTYPFVTSSNPRFPPYRTDKNLGVMKAFMTRVGAGPRPTVIGGETEERIRGDRESDRTADFGATTGRPRSCCWFDGPIARYAAIVGEIDRIVITKLDKLDGIDPVLICTGYRYKNDILKLPPQERGVWEHCEPVYKKWPGWPPDNSPRAREFSELHPNAQRFLIQLSDLTERKIELISVGPEAEQTIALD